MSTETPREVVTRLAKAPTDPGLTAIAHALLDLADAIRSSRSPVTITTRPSWTPVTGSATTHGEPPMYDRPGVTA